MHQTSNIDDGYLGSGLALGNAIKKYGRENFTREILEYCSSYNDLIEKEKVYVDADWVSNSDNYNLKTGGQSAGILSDISKSKISETLKRKYQNGLQSWSKGLTLKPQSEDHKNKVSASLVEKYKNEDHNRLGKEPWNKGLVGAQVGWNKGLKLGPMSDEEKEKRSKTLKNRYKIHEHPTKGREPWNKGLLGAQVAWNKGKKTDKVECPYCKKLVDIANGKRWHFDNCKQKNIISI